MTAAGSARPPLALELAWQQQGLRFVGRTSHGELPLDGDGVSATSPVEALAFSLASCMASDVVLILEKGRQPLQGLSVAVTGWRAEEPPRRLLRVELRFRLRGALESDKVERALALSRDTYCSVWQSLRQDIELTTPYTIEG